MMLAVPLLQAARTATVVSFSVSEPFKCTLPSAPGAVALMATVLKPSARNVASPSDFLIIVRPPLPFGVHQPVSDLAALAAHVQTPGQPASGRERRRSQR